MADPKELRRRQVQRNSDDLFNESAADRERLRRLQNGPLAGGGFVHNGEGFINAKYTDSDLQGTPTVRRDDPDRPSTQEQLGQQTEAQKTSVVSQPFAFGVTQKQAAQQTTPKPIISAYKNYYYSGAQAQIYFEDVFIDEMTSLQFTTVTNKAPIYGYHSIYFDTVAEGNLIIQGSFSINFVQAGYLPIISAAIYDQKFGDNGAIGRIGDQFRTDETSLSPDAKESARFREVQAFNQVRNMGNLQFRKLAQQRTLEQMKQGIFFPEKFYNLPPFDIYAIFGDYTNTNANHTVRVIRNVHLTGQAQTIISNGQPVEEAYTFIARDIE